MRHRQAASTLTHTHTHTHTHAKGKSAGRNLIGWFLFLIIYNIMARYYHIVAHRLSKTLDERFRLRVNVGVGSLPPSLPPSPPPPLISI